MSWANSCAHSGPQGGGPGTSALGSSLGVPCGQPRQIIHSISFHPNSAACRNILWRMNRWWGPPAFHCRYSLRNRSVSRWHSTSLTDSLSLFASSFMWPEIYATYHLVATLIKHGNLKQQQKVLHKLQPSNCTSNTM